MSNTSRIAKNTLMLYFRQILIVLVSLYTVRAVLNILGAEDYGIFNVVGGTVSILGFLTGLMASASQRFLSFEIGRGDFEQLKRVFDQCLLIYILIALIVFLLAETIGVWIVDHQLVIPFERKNASKWSYQFSVLSFIFTILAMPYMSVIIAHEDMDIYAIISIIGTILKLMIVFILRFTIWDKLPVYSILLCLIAAINTVIYIIICMIKYKECKFRLYGNKDLFLKIMSYMNWNLLSHIAYLCKTSGITILLNQMFNPIIVSARAISLQIDGVLFQFSYNIAVAIRPQIVKYYAAGEKEKMFQLLFQGIKATYFLMYIFLLPCILELPQLLFLWIKNPPEYTIIFSRLMLINLICNSFLFLFDGAVQATGKIKGYYIVYSFINILNLPVSFIVLSLGAPVYFVYIVGNGLLFVQFLVQLFIVRDLIDLSLCAFFKDIVVPLIGMSLIAAILPVFLHIVLIQGILRLFCVVLVSCFSISISMYFFGLNVYEREKIKLIVLSKIWKKV